MVLLRMDKTRIFTVIVCTVFVFSLVSCPNVFVQAAYTGVTVLSHSSYVNSSGHFIVLGEVQNTGNHVLGNVSLNVVVSASNGSQLVSGTTTAYVNDFLPQQKAPFYLDFGKIDFNTISEVNTFDFNVSNHPPTNYIEYPGLSLIVTFNGIVNDAYVVSGSITNSGSQTANDIKVVGTYYNSAGIVVAVGFVILNDPLIPNNSVNFTVSEFDAVPKLVTKISNYSLLVQTSTQQFNLPSSASPTPSTASSGSSWIVYVGVSAVVIVVVAFATLVFLRKRKESRKETR
jgi:LPXTG-motif cell wall-anchored protein